MLLSVIAAVALATILAVVAGLTPASSASPAHDLYAGVLRPGRTTGEQEVRVGRISAVVIGAVAIAPAIPAQGLDVAFLVAIAVAMPRRPICRRSSSLISDPGVDLSWFPLDNPGLVSVPLGFFAWLGTATRREWNKAWAEMEVRSPTGAGAEKAAEH